MSGTGADETGFLPAVAPPKDERVVKQLTRIAEALEKLERHFQRAGDKPAPAYTERLK